MNFKINSRPLFTIILKLKNDNFKTQDFSPHIERVLAGVDREEFKEPIKEEFVYNPLFILTHFKLAENFERLTHSDDGFFVIFPKNSNLH